MKRVFSILAAACGLAAVLTSSAVAGKVYASHSTNATGTSEYYFDLEVTALRLAESHGKNQIREMCSKSGFSSADQFFRGEKSCKFRSGSGYKCELVVGGYCYDWE